MKKIEFLPWVMAGAFGVWCIFVWSAGNDWKELFVFYPTYPFSLLIAAVNSAIQNIIIPQPKLALEKDWILLNCIHGSVYFVMGVAWFFAIGWACKKLITRKKSTRS